ncbi:MAG TPA: glycine cleavage system protein GcvH [Trueperaceae bacterium]
MNIPDDRRYNKTHEWAQEADGMVTVGISDFAQDQLGDVVFVELPNVGQAVKAGEAVAVVESVKTASDIYAPVDGEVAEVNELLESKPELINESPYAEGWMFRISAASADMSGLLDADSYRAVAEEDS